MNSITQAFANTGVKPKPAGQLAWAWLKDHPDKTTAEIVTALKSVAKKPAVEKALQQLRSSGRVSAARVSLDSTTSIYGKISTYRYRALGASYDNPPKVAPLTLAAPAVPSVLTLTTHRPPQPSAATSAHAGPTTKPASKVDIESLTLREARDLFNALNALFGSDK